MSDTKEQFMGWLLVATLTIIMVVPIILIGLRQ